MGVLIMLTVTSLASLRVWCQMDMSVCNQTQSNKAGPPLPKLPDQFTMQVEVNVLNKNVSMDVREWHDGMGNRGAALQWVVGVPLKYIFSYATNEMFTIEQVNGGTASLCKVRDLNATDRPYFFGVQAGASGPTPHIYSAARALMFGGTQQEQYMGRSTVRGMPTDVWQSCVYWPDMAATMLVEWHFTVQSGWDNALGISQIPVMCHVTGKRTNPEHVLGFEHLYEITRFRDYLDGGVEVFETPAGTVCPGRKETKALPELPHLFSYNAEVLNVEQSFTQYLKKAYDSNLKFAMLEFASAAPPRTKLRQIDDFNTGVSYTLDMVHGNCSVSTIDPSGFDAIRTASSSVRMCSPQEFFFGTATDYSYEGIRNIRGLNSEVWVGTRWGWPPNNPTNSTWEYYFATPEWTEIAGVTSADHMPVSIHVTLGRTQAHQVYNLYNFRDDDPDIWNYDISACFDVSRIRQVQMTFTVTPSQLQRVLDNQHLFRRSLLSSVMSLVSVSPIRLNRISLEFRSVAVDVTLVLTEMVQLPAPVVDSPLQEVNLETAAQRLQAAISTKTFAVTLNLTTDYLRLMAMPYTGVTHAQMGGPTQEVLGGPRPVSAASQAKFLSVSFPPRSHDGGQHVVVCTTKSSGYTAGDLAGVTMGTAFACFLLGLVGLSLWSRLRGSSFPYGLHEMELSSHEST